MLVKDLILNNPDLPFVVVVHKDDSPDFCGCMSIYEDAEGYIGEIFEHSDFEGKTFFDREELEDAVYESSPHELSDDELKTEATKYAPYWKKCIIMEL